MKVPNKTKISDEMLFSQNFKTAAMMTGFFGLAVMNLHLMAPGITGCGHERPGDDVGVLFLVNRVCLFRSLIMPATCISGLEVLAAKVGAKAIASAYSRYAASVPRADDPPLNLDLARRTIHKGSAPSIR